jgi:hypothetical protein
MSKTGLEIFDTTLQETNHYLKRAMEELQTDDRKLAFTALRATLHALRDRIGPANAVHLAAQLPMLLRGAYYEAGASPRHPLTNAIWVIFCPMLTPICRETLKSDLERPLVRHSSSFWNAWMRAKRKS